MHCALSFDLVGEDVLITGAGPIGIMAAAVCRHVGARHVVVTDVVDSRYVMDGAFAFGGRGRGELFAAAMSGWFGLNQRCLDEGRGEEEKRRERWERRERREGEEGEEGGRG